MTACPAASAPSATLPSPAHPAPSPEREFSAQRALHMACQALDIEAAAVTQAVQRLRQQPDTAGQLLRGISLILSAGGRIVVMGMGKSGHVGRKIAATLASTGTAALFVHPAEASHGDLGMVCSHDVVLAISNSGESEELTRILPVFRRTGVPIIAMTGAPQSSLARHASVVLDSSVAQEACPLNLAPTASTTVQMALGDALAVALLDARGFRAEDFARSHPGGALGRRLLTTVADVMRPRADTPVVTLSADLGALMREMSAKGMGAALVLDESGRVAGIFTDGDLRRLLEAGTDWRGLHAAQLMHANPHTIAPDALAADAARLMEEHRISSLAVVDVAGQLQGGLHMHDLMRAKVI